MGKKARGKRTRKLETPSEKRKPNRKSWNWVKLFWSLVFTIASFIASTFAGGMLSNTNPQGGAILFAVCLCVIFGYWTWVLVGKVTIHMKYHKWIRIIGIVLVLVAVWSAMPLYIDRLPQQDTIHFDQFYFDSTKVVVRYGNRTKDFFWTDTTIGALKQKTEVSLNINGYNIFTIHTDGKQIYVDALLFAGYENYTIADYTSFGSADNITITIKGYFDTNVPGYYYNKPLSNIIKNKPFRKPVVVTNNALNWNPGGWNTWGNSSSFKVTNENNIPVLVVEYKTPCEIIISGIFLTPEGILKVDNTEDTIFFLGASPIELGIYTVDKIKPHSIFDFFNPKETYMLEDNGR